MSKKKHYPPRLVKVADKTGDTFNFPAERHVVTPAQREVPNPAGALAAMTQPQPSERARLRAATVREEIHAERRRPLDAPMATRPGDLPDPFAQDLWAAIADAMVAPALTLWERVKFPAAFVGWSIGCFMLGRLA